MDHNLKKLYLIIIILLLLLSTSCSQNTRVSLEDNSSLIEQKNDFYYEDNRICSFIPEEKIYDENKILCNEIIVQYSPLNKLVFQIYYTLNNNIIDAIYLKEKDQDDIIKIHDIDDQKYVINPKVFEFNLYSYHIIDIKNGEFSTWINMFDYMSEEQIKELEKNRPKITNLQKIDSIYFQMEDGYYQLNPDFVEKIQEFIVQIPEDAAHDIKDGRPTWAIYATIYAVNQKEIHQIRLCLEGIIYDGVLYKCDTTLLNNIISRITNGQSLY